MTQLKKLKIISIQLWNNNNEQEVCKCKTMESAQKALIANKKQDKKSCNNYRIEEI